jgi:hypothetical protein
MIKITGWYDVTLLKPEKIFKRYQRHLGIIKTTHLVLAYWIPILRKTHHGGIHAHHIYVMNLFLIHALLV